MVNFKTLKRKKCFEDGCNIIPSFNYKNEKKPQFCSEHQKEGMVNLLKLKYKKCIEDGCHIIPNYNYENEKEALYCSKHKLTNMVDLNRKKCLDCNKIPAFNIDGLKTPI
jgi:hypothetical protein